MKRIAMKHRASLGTLLRITPVGLLLCGSLAGFLASSSPAADPALRDNKYIGAGKCESCHDAEASGNQFGSWKEAGHSHAMEALKSDEAKKSTCVASCTRTRRSALTERSLVSARYLLT